MLHAGDGAGGSVSGIVDRISQDALSSAESGSGWAA